MTSICLVVSEFDSVAAAPSRTAFWGSESWADIDGNGCDAKNDAMAAQSTVAVTRSGRCTVTTGRWLSYDGIYATERAQIQGDHIVPLENAAGHGAGAWDAAKRRLFANDPIEIRITSAGSNSSKGMSGPEDWRPADPNQQCSYAEAWVAVKLKWGLTVAAAERQALAQMLSTCGGAPSTPAPAETVRGGRTNRRVVSLVFAVEDPSGCTTRSLPDSRWLLVEFMIADDNWIDRCLTKERRPENIGGRFMVCWPNDTEMAMARQRQASG